MTTRPNNARKFLLAFSNVSTSILLWLMLYLAVIVASQHWEDTIDGERRRHYVKNDYGRLSMAPDCTGAEECGPSALAMLGENWPDKLGGHSDLGEFQSISDLPQGYEGKFNWANNNSMSGKNCDFKRLGLSCRFSRRCGRYRYNKLLEKGKPKTKTYSLENENDLTDEDYNTSEEVDARTSGYVINALNTSLGEWPMIAQIKFDDKYRTQYVTACTGFLVTGWHVVASKTCMDILSKFLNRVHIDFGPRSSNEANPTIVAQTRVPKKICAHKSGWDTAIILLNRKVELDDMTQPVCPVYDFMVEPETRSLDGTCYLVGFGKTRFDVKNYAPQAYPNIMRVLEQDCDEKTRAETPHIRCFKGLDMDSVACKADLGAPIVCHSADEPARWMVVGMITNASECDDYSATKWPDQVLPIDQSLLQLTSSYDDCLPPRYSKYVDDTEDYLENDGKCPWNNDVSACDHYNYCGRGYDNGYTPFFVRIVVHNHVKLVNRTCGGILIADNTVLTTSECLVDSNTNTLLDKKGIVLTPGAYAIRGTNAPYGILQKDRLVTKICRNKEYPRNEGSEVALKRRALARLTLNEHVTMYKTVRGIGLEAACWPYPTRRDLKLEGPKSHCVVYTLEFGRKDLVVEKVIEKTPCANAELVDSARMACWRLTERGPISETRSIGDDNEGAPILCQDGDERMVLVAIVVESETSGIDSMVAYSALVDPEKDLLKQDYDCV